MRFFEEKLTIFYTLLLGLALSLFCVLITSPYAGAITKCVDYDYDAPNKGETELQKLPSICMNVEDMGDYLVVVDGEFALVDRDGDTWRAIGLSVDGKEESGTGTKLSFDCNTTGVSNALAWLVGNGSGEDVGCPTDIKYSEFVGMRWGGKTGAENKLVQYIGQAIEATRQVRHADDYTSAQYKLMKSGSSDTVIIDYANYDPSDPTGGTSADGTSTTVSLNSYEQERVSRGIDSGTSTASCFSAASGLGWVVCAVADYVADGAQLLYSKFIEPMLTINSDLFSGGGSNGNTYSAWQTFQTFANVLFVIMLLFVIFSQLTGIGIDNYGIKKILPRLIVGVLLINLSYIICLAVIDVSNIVGSAILDLFQAMADGLDFKAAEFTNAGGGPVGTAVSIIGIIAGIVTVYLSGKAAIAFFSGGRTAATTMILVAALGVGLAILMLFVILAVRQAAVVILTVLSPLAFVCYMLPNTKNLFSKWVNLMKSMLLLYPICGLVMGAGGYAGLLLISVASVNDWFLVFAGMVMAVGPIFMIPSLLKRSLSALGNVGAMVGGLTRSLPRAATGRVRNTEAYKYAQNSARLGQSEKLAESARKVADTYRDASKQKGLRGRYARLRYGMASNSAARYGAMAGKIKKERDDNELYASEAGYVASEASRESSKLEARDKNNLSYITNRRVRDPETGEERLQSDEERKAEFQQLVNSHNSGAQLNEDQMSMMRSYVDYFAGKGGKHLGTVEDVISNAERNSGGRLSAGTAQVLSAQLMKHGAIKDKAPGLSQFAKVNSDLADGKAVQSMDESIVKGIGKLTQKKISGVEDFELAKMKAAVIGSDGNPPTFQGDGAQNARDRLVRLSRETLSNPNNVEIDEANEKIMSSIIGAGAAKSATGGASAPNIPGGGQQASVNPHQVTMTNLGSGGVTRAQVDAMFNAVESGNELGTEAFGDNWNSIEVKRAMAARQMGKNSDAAAANRTGVAMGANENIDFSAAAAAAGDRYKTVDVNGNESVDVDAYVNDMAEQYMNDAGNKDVVRYMNMAENRPEQFRTELSNGQVAAGPVNTISNGALNGNKSMGRVYEKSDDMKVAGMIASTGVNGGVSRGGTIMASSWNNVTPKTGNGGATEVVKANGVQEKMNRAQMITYSNERLQAMVTQRQASERRQAQDQKLAQGAGATLNIHGGGTPNAERQAAVESQRLMNGVRPMGTGGVPGVNGAGTPGEASAGGGAGVGAGFNGGAAQGQTVERFGDTTVVTRGERSTTGSGIELSPGAVAQMQRERNVRQQQPGAGQNRERGR